MESSITVAMDDYQSLMREPYRNIRCRRFIVLLDGCLYYYNNEMSKSENGAFSLYGYDQVCRAHEVEMNEAPWAFTLTHKDPAYKTYYFSAPSLQHMKEWMRYLKTALRKANSASHDSRTDADGQSASGGSITFDELESKIYDDPDLVFQPTTKKTTKFQNEGSDDDGAGSDGEGFYMQMVDANPVSKRPLPELPSQRMQAAKCPSKAAMKIPRDVPQKHQDVPRNPSGKTAPAIPAKPAGAAVNTKTIPQERHVEATSPRSIIKRGGPDGSSMIRKFVETLPSDTAQLSLEEQESEAYWKSVIYSGDKTEATEIVRRIGKDGVYLVRDGTDGQVIVLWHDSCIRKYKIYHEDGHYFVNKQETFDSLAELLYHYHSHDIRAGVRLTVPFSKYPHS